MIKTKDLREIGRARLADAQVLYNARRYDGAFYLGEDLAQHTRAEVQHDQAAARDLTIVVHAMDLAVRQREILDADVFTAALDVDADVDVAGVVEGNAAAGARAPYFGIAGHWRAGGPVRPSDHHER